MDISVVLNQMGILVLIMLIGFICAKIKLTGPQFTKSCSAVVMNVLLVSTILSSAMQSDLSLSIGKVFGLMGVGTLMLAVSAAAGLAAPRLLGIKGDDRGLAFFMILLMNSVFVGYPVIEAVYGPEGVFYASLSNIPFNIVAYTVGVGAVRGWKGGLTLRSAVSPPLIATVVAVVIMLTRVQLPAVITDTCSTLGKATVPMCMLVIGTSLGGVSVRRAISDWRVYVLSFVRLLVCPVLTWLVLGLVVSDPMTLGVYTILAASPIAMLATVFAVQYGKNETFASEGVFISTVLSAVTMPLIVWLLIL